MLEELTSRTYKISATEWKAKYFPTRIARTTVDGADLIWYEHPTLGDEAGLIILTTDGKVHPTSELEPIGDFI